MMNYPTYKTVRFEKWPGNWSPPTFKDITLIEAACWLTKHKYTAYYAITIDGVRHIKYRKPNCKTEYVIIMKL